MLACAWDWGHPGESCPYVGTVRQCAGCKVTYIQLEFDFTGGSHGEYCC